MTFEEMEAAQRVIDGRVQRYIDQMPVPKTLDIALAEREFWIREACRFSRNEEYYRDLVDRVGLTLGDEAYIADDGSRSDDILRDKVPELAAHRIDEARWLFAQIAQMHSTDNGDIAERCMELGRKGYALLSRDRGSKPVRAATAQTGAVHESPGAGTAIAQKEAS